MIRQKEKWYRNGLRFSCVKCGNCCGGDPGYVWVTKDEIVKIARHLGRADDWLDKKHLRRVGLKYSLTEKPNGDCIFLQRTVDGSPSRDAASEPGRPQPGLRYPVGDNPALNGDLAGDDPPLTVCLVYPVRPRQCRTWPFWPEVLRSRDAWDRATEKCPGIGKGKYHDLLAIENLRLTRA